MAEKPTSLTKARLAKPTMVATSPRLLTIGTTSRMCFKTFSPQSVRRPPFQSQSLNWAGRGIDMLSRGSNWINYPQCERPGLTPALSVADGPKTRLASWLTGAPLIYVFAFGLQKPEIQFACWQSTAIGNPANPRVSRLLWRRGWDSNPRRTCIRGGFQDRCHKPLGHLSTSRPRKQCTESQRSKQAERRGA